MSFAKRYDPIPVNDTFSGIYAHGVELPVNATTLLVSGQVGVAPDGKLPADFKGQCRQAFENLRTVLVAADMSMSDIVKTTFYLTRPEDMDDLVLIRKEFIDGVRPANTTLFVNGLVSPDWFVEIEAIACKPVTDIKGRYAKFI